MAKRDYLVEAAKQIHMALDSEVNEDYEAAFSYYKNGVDLLLNGVQLDPNKDRREAVKRKTTQYLKRAEEIFITHLQDNLGKGSSHLGGYSSLRFRPVRHLSSPVEDLEMCKVVGVNDKVLIVQSMVNKETFVVKSLVKSSWESREQPTIIPQGVPYMVKLLRYYVSEDVVYLHLEHVKGGRLFSKLNKLRNRKAKDHPECDTSGQHNIRLKTSYTSPAIYTDYQHSKSSSTENFSKRLSDESPDTDYPTSWDETQQRLESCGTHSYIEETGCLENSRSAPSYRNKHDRLTLFSGLMGMKVGTHIHPPAPSLHFYSSESQEKPALPLPCRRVSQALEVMSELHEKKAGAGLIECSSDFEMAWKAAETANRCGEASPYTVTDSGLDSMSEHTAPYASQNPLTQTESAKSERNGLSSSPAILHLPLHCQTQIRGREPWGINGTQQDAVLSGNADVVTELVQHSRDTKLDSNGLTTEERNGVVVIRSTDRAVLSDLTHTGTNSPFSFSLCYSNARKQETLSGVPLALSDFNADTEFAKVREGAEEACELVCPAEKVMPSKEGSFSNWYSPRLLHNKTNDCLLKSERLQHPDEDQITEVDGWCYLPQVRVKSYKSTDKAVQECWGLPEGEVRVWGAQILLALESLHQQGILCCDLNPRNVLLTSNGKVCLTFFGQWSEVQSEISTKAMEQMYCAPEIGGVTRVTESCDWWSLGALLFELLTGMPLWQLHPAGIHSHTQLLIPDHLSPAAASLLTELLQFDAGYRLGSGGGGVSDIKCHPFFSSISWKALSC